MSPALFHHGTLAHCYVIPSHCCWVTNVRPLILTQVEAGGIFDPVNENPSLCPFSSTRMTRSVPSRHSKKGVVSDWIRNRILNAINKVAWEHKIDRYVFTLGHTCIAKDDPLWDFVWPSRIPPVKPADV